MTRRKFNRLKVTTKAKMSENPTKNKTINGKRIVTTIASTSAVSHEAFTERPKVTRTNPEDYALSADTDVIFLLDASKYVTVKNYKKQKVFVQSLCQHFGISTNGPRASVLFYSSNAYSLFAFTEYNGILELKERLVAAPLLGRMKRIDRALLLAYQMFSQLGRQGPKVALLFVNGIEGVKHSQQSPLKQALETLLTITAKLYVIAAGSLSVSDFTMLESLVIKPDDVLFLSLEKNLQNQAKAVAEHVRLTYGNTFCIFYTACNPSYIYVSCKTHVYIAVMYHTF